ncbi:MAG TPA: hypothetical protein VFX16_00365 [Pseudonocardiaceae bacterium]|nr:hypothetical protein [Pseudonocardiaceae bacterium]
MSTVRQRRHDNAVSARHLGKFLGRSGLVITVVSAGLTFLFAR